MISQTSLTPYIASPVSAYQVCTSGPDSSAPCIGCNLMCLRMLNSFQVKSESNFVQLLYLVCHKLPSIWHSDLLFCVGEWKAREMLGIIPWSLNRDEPGSFLHHVSQEWKLGRITDWRADARSCPCLVPSRKRFFKKAVKTANTGSSLLGDINWCSRDLRSFSPPRSKRPLISSCLIVFFARQLYLQLYSQLRNEPSLSSLSHTDLMVFRG